MAKQFLRPGEGRRVLLPGRTEVPAAGMEMEVTLFVQRRIDCGDLVALAEAPPPDAQQGGAATGATAAVSGSASALAAQGAPLPLTSPPQGGV
jgi:hypothetical protein